MSHYAIKLETLLYPCDLTTNPLRPIFWGVLFCYFILKEHPSKI